MKKEVFTMNQYGSVKINIKIYGFREHNQKRTGKSHQYKI